MGECPPKGTGEEKWPSPRGDNPIYEYAKYLLDKTSASGSSLTEFLVLTEHATANSPSENFTSESFSQDALANFAVHSMCKMNCLSTFNIFCPTDLVHTISASKDGEGGNFPFLFQQNHRIRRSLQRRLMSKRRSRQPARKERGFARGATTLVTERKEALRSSFFKIRALHIKICRSLLIG